MNPAQYETPGRIQTPTTRCDFPRFASAGLGLGAAARLSAAPRPLKIGHTGITWGNNSEQAIADVAGRGLYGFEPSAMSSRTGKRKNAGSAACSMHNLPLISAYCTFNMTDPNNRKDELDKMRAWGELLLKNGGHVSVLGPNSVPRASYDFKAVKSVPVLHQHTGAWVQSRDEVYSIRKAIDSRFVKFGPDIGQLQKGGVDPVKVVGDYLPLVRHIHLKDYSGGDAYLGYCPLGQGKVDVSAILDLAAKADLQGKVMVELDPSPGMPIPAGEPAKIARTYLQGLGCEFRS